MDFYDDDEPMTEEAPMEEGAPQGESDTAKTALIDSSICPGMAPGDKIELTIEKVLDSGEYAVRYDKPVEEEPLMEESMAPESEVGAYME